MNEHIYKNTNKGALLSYFIIGSTFLLCSVIAFIDTIKSSSDFISWFLIIFFFSISYLSFQSFFIANTIFFSQDNITVKYFFYSKNIRKETVSGYKTKTGTFGRFYKTFYRLYLYGKGNKKICQFTTNNAQVFHQIVKNLSDLPKL